MTRLSQRRPKAAMRSPPSRVIDEAQRLPEVFTALRYVIDRSPGKGRFLLLGSASPTLMRSVSETLAGRVALLELTPFLASELAGTARAVAGVAGRKQELLLTLALVRGSTKQSKGSPSRKNWSTMPGCQCRTKGGAMILPDVNVLFHASDPTLMPCAPLRSCSGSGRRCDEPPPRVLVVVPVAEGGAFKTSAMAQKIPALLHREFI